MIKLRLQNAIISIAIASLYSCESGSDTRTYTNGTYTLSVTQENRLTCEENGRWIYYKPKKVSLKNEATNQTVTFNEAPKIYRDDLDGTILEGSLCADYSQSAPDTPENIYLSGPIFYIQTDSICFNISFKRDTYDKCNLWILSSKLPEFKENKEYTLLLNPKE